MRRYAVLRKLIGILNENDIAIFSGSEMCKEAYQYDRPGNFYISEPSGLAASFALGVAMSTTKRVFVFIGEGEFLKDFIVALQIKSSQARNIFLVLLDNGMYQSAGGFPNIMEHFKSKSASIFNMGLAVFNFDIYFKGNNFKNLPGFMNNLRGPASILINVDPGTKKNLPDIEVSSVDLKNRFFEFVRNIEVGTSSRSIAGPILRIDDIKAEVL